MLFVLFCFVILLRLLPPPSVAHQKGKVSVRLVLGSAAGDY